MRVRMSVSVSEVKRKVWVVYNASKEQSKREGGLSLSA